MLFCCIIMVKLNLGGKMDDWETLIKNLREDEPAFKEDMIQIIMEMLKLETL